MCRRATCPKHENLVVLAPKHDSGISGSEHARVRPFPVFADLSQPPRHALCIIHHVIGFLSDSTPCQARRRRLIARYLAGSRPGLCEETRRVERARGEAGSGYSERAAYTRGFLVGLVKHKHRETINKGNVARMPSHVFAPPASKRTTEEDALLSRPTRTERKKCLFSSLLLVLLVLLSPFSALKVAPRTRRISSFKHEPSHTLSAGVRKRNEGGRITVSRMHFHLSGDGGRSALQRNGSPPVANPQARTGRSETTMNTGAKNVNDVSITRQIV